jgi:hypothetical protein
MPDPPGDDEVGRHHGVPPEDREGFRVAVDMSVVDRDDE